MFAPTVNKKQTSLGHGGGQKICEELEVPFLGEILIYTTIRESGDKGGSLVQDQPVSLAAKTYGTITGNLVAEITKNTFE